MPPSPITSWEGMKAQTPCDLLTTLAPVPATGQQIYSFTRHSQNFSHRLLEGLRLMGRTDK